MATAIVAPGEDVNVRVLPPENDSNDSKEMTKKDAKEIG